MMLCLIQKDMYLKYISGVICMEMETSYMFTCEYVNSFVYNSCISFIKLTKRYKQLLWIKSGLIKIM